MPWLRFGKASVPVFDGIDPADATSRELAAREGNHQCTAAGCTATTGLPCEYVDRRDRHCRTAWCPQHRLVLLQHVFCRRHSGIIAALPSADSALSSPLPDLENRAPSLVGWMAKQLDSDIWQLMLRELQAESAGQLVSDPVALVFVGIERQRGWERAWSLALPGGDRRRVSLLVEEALDSELVVRVGVNVVDRVTPPWIQHRMRGEGVDEEQDRDERARFNQRVLDAMQRGLERERELSERDGAHRWSARAGQG